MSASRGGDPPDGPGPAVSVVIAAYNAAHFLPTAIDSVLAQTLTDLELIVVDDGSTDTTRQVLSGYAAVRALRVLRNPTNIGVARARNRGIESARGRYLAFLDADDAWLPTKLERQLQALERSGAAACHCAFVDADASLKPEAVHRTIRRGSALSDLLLLGNVVGPPSAVICERTLIRQVGSFDPETHYCSDWDLWLRLAVRTEITFLDEALVLYRRHAAQFSRQLSLLEEDSIRVLRRALQMPSLPPQLRELQPEILGRNYIVLAGSYFSAGLYRDCLRCLMRGLRLSPRLMGYLLRYPLRVIERRKAGPPVAVCC